MPQTDIYYLEKLAQTTPDLHILMDVLPGTLSNWLRTKSAPTYVEAFAKHLYTKTNIYRLKVQPSQQQVLESFLNAIGIPWEQD